MQSSQSTLTHGLSVVTPVYNSEGTLAQLITRLQPVLQAQQIPYEVVFVNDGSRDGSSRVIEKLCHDHDWITGIDLTRNYGQHNALLCGIRMARYDTIITIDDDLQNPPEEIPKLLADLTENIDVVYGFPENQQAHGLLRGLASNITKIVLQRTMGAETARHVSAFRAFRTELRSAFTTYRSPFVSIDVLLTWATSKFTARRVRNDARTIGASNYTVYKLTTHALNMMTGFTTFPLQLASICGFTFTAFGMLLLVFVVGRFLLTGTTVPGFTFLASIISIFSGAQLFALGIIGEYLARLHMRTMDRPAYNIRRCVSSASDHP